MKKKKGIFIMIGIVLVIVISVIFCFSLNRTEYTLAIPKEADSFTSIIIERNDEIVPIENSENIQNLMNILSNKERTTYEESIQDFPVNADGVIIITFNDTKSSTLFLYKKNSKYYIEQPYNGIYEITKEEYNEIRDFYQGLKEEVTNMEKTSLTTRVEKLEPADWLGKSFKTEDLTNEELLRLGFELFGPTKNSGFVDITFTSLNKTYIRGYFGREDASPKDITCSCGKVITTYNSGNDTFTWDSEFHYLAHRSSVYNEILDMYKVEDKYIVRVYKIFSDTMENSSIDKYNFYSTYNDAVNKENILFTVTTEDEFTSALSSLENDKKVLYTLTFKKDGTFKLVNYEINN